MKKWARISLVLALSSVLIVMPVHASGMPVTIQGEQEELTYGDQMEDIMRTILDKYLDSDDVSAQSLYEAAMEGMFNSLDKYSTYIPAEDSTGYTNGLNNTYVGIGVQLIQDEDYITVTRVFFDGPAEGAGLIVHDRIIGVNGDTIVGFTPQEAANLILGDEGTEVTLTIDRSGYIFDLVIVRGRVIINAIDQLDIMAVVPELDDAVASKIGYLKIESFTNGVDEELEPILNEFKLEGKTHLLLDLRDNGGGYVDSAVKVLDMLVPEGPVLRFINNEGREIVYRSNNQSVDFEIVALINDNSASATEFVAASLQETGTGILVGENTYGKGVAQYLHNQADGALVKLTQEAFYSGNNVAIHGIGVAPDIAVALPDYLTKAAKYHYGEQYPEVVQVEEILTYLGYAVGEADETYDWATYEAVKQFQADQELYPYGVCDFGTQDALNRALIEAIRENDVQLNKAVETIVELVRN